MVAWGTESYSGLAENTYFVYLTLRASALDIGQTVRLGTSGMEIYFYLVLCIFIFYLLIIFCVKFLQNRQVMVTSLVSGVDLVGDSPRAPIAEAPATFWERWGRVGRMMTMEWSVSLRVCRVWVGERNAEPHEGWDCFKIREMNKQTQTKWFLFFFFFLKKDYFNR